MKNIFIAIILWFAAGACATEVYTFEDPKQEKLYSNLTHEMRCLVCQNQSIADSNADLAKDLRRQIHEMVEQGHSAQEIIDYMVARYGNFILYRPPFNATTALLWSAPFLLLALGLVVIVRVSKRGQPQPELDDQQRERIQHLLNDKS